jgi:hypothetical protein
LPKKYQGTSLLASRHRRSVATGEAIQGSICSKQAELELGDGTPPHF